MRMLIESVRFFFGTLMVAGLLALGFSPAPLSSPPAQGDPPVRTAPPVAR